MQQCAPGAARSCQRAKARGKGGVKRCGPGAARTVSAPRRDSKSNERAPPKGKASAPEREEKATSAHRARRALPSVRGKAEKSNGNSNSNGNTRTWPTPRQAQKAWPVCSRAKPARQHKAPGKGNGKKCAPGAARTSSAPRRGSKSQVKATATPQAIVAPPAAVTACRVALRCASLLLSCKPCRLPGQWFVPSRKKCAPGAARTSSAPRREAKAIKSNPAFCMRCKSACRHLAPHMQAYFICGLSRVRCAASRP